MRGRKSLLAYVSEMRHKAELSPKERWEMEDGRGEILLISVPFPWRYEFTVYRDGEFQGYVDNPSLAKAVGVYYSRELGQPGWVINQGSEDALPDWVKEQANQLITSL